MAIVLVWGRWPLRQMRCDLVAVLSLCLCRDVIWQEMLALFLTSVCTTIQRGKCQDLQKCYKRRAKLSTIGKHLQAARTCTANAGGRAGPERLRLIGLWASGSIKSGYR